MATFVAPRTTRLRTLAQVGCMRSRPGQAKAACAMSGRPCKHTRQSSLSTRPGITARIVPQSFSPITISVRTASSAPAASPSPGSTGQPTPEDALTWNRFFDLRKKRRYVNVVASILTSMGTVGVVAPLLAQQDIDSWGAQISGLDPVIVLGVSTFAVAAGGWLCGPTFGSALFGLWAGRRGWNRLIAEKEKSFFARIKRYRADPSSSSPQNPIPDYYGEKIASVKDYRRWLKDQRAFNLKKDKNII